LYVPAVRPLWLPVPLYGGVPPEADTAAEPFDPPKQLTFDVTLHDADNGEGWLMVTVHEASQPFASVTE